MNLALINALGSMIRLFIIFNGPVKSQVFGVWVQMPTQHAEENLIVQNLRILINILKINFIISSTKIFAILCQIIIQFDILINQIMT